MAHDNDSHPNGPHFTVEIDDEEYDVTTHEALVADLIRLTGGDPANLDLIEVKGRNQRPLADGDMVKISSGSKFVTVSTEPTPVA